MGGKPTKIADSSWEDLLRNFQNELDREAPLVCDQQYDGQRIIEAAQTFLEALPFANTLQSVMAVKAKLKLAQLEGTSTTRSLKIEKAFAKIQQIVEIYRYKTIIELLYQLSPMGRVDEVGDPFQRGSKYVAQVTAGNFSSITEGLAYMFCQFASHQSNTIPTLESAVRMLNALASQVNQTLESSYSTNLTGVCFVCDVVKTYLKNINEVVKGPKPTKTHPLYNLHKQLKKRIEPMLDNLKHTLDRDRCKDPDQDDPSPIRRKYVSRSPIDIVRLENSPELLLPVTRERELYTEDVLSKEDHARQLSYASSPRFKQLHKERLKNFWATKKMPVVSQRLLIGEKGTRKKHSKRIDNFRRDLQKYKTHVTEIESLLEKMEKKYDDNDDEFAIIT